MKAVIVEDQFIIADHLQDILEQNGVKVLDTVDNVSNAEKTLYLKPDFYLLDIRLADKQTGIDFGKRLYTLSIPFVYITANNESVVLKQAIATAPVAYITKPFKENDIIAALELVKLKIRRQPTLTIIGPKGEREILEMQILFCEADSAYSLIHTQEEVIIQRLTLKDLEALLSPDFIRVHRSFLVNKHHISSQKAQSLFVGNKEIPVSRNFRE